MRGGFPVGGIPGILLQSVRCLSNKMQLNSYLQPVNLLVMCQAEYKLVHYPVCPNRATNEIQLSIFGVVEDKVVEVKFAQLSTSNPSSDLASISFGIDR